MRSKGLAVAMSLAMLVGLAVSSPAMAQVRDHDWTFGFRAGVAVPTQDLTTETFDAGVGPVINLHALYSLSPLFAAGLALEWQRHGVDTIPGNADLGTLNTISILPTVEVRPAHYGKFAPYGSLGVGININSFSEKEGVASVNPPTTGALRVAVGTDFMLTDRLALNAELAWKYNYGNMEIAGVSGTPFNASTMMFLVGARWR